MESNFKVYALMVLTAFLWSGAFIAGKYTGPYIPSSSVTFLRFAIATVLIPFTLLEKPWVFVPEIPASAWIALLFMAMFCSGIAYYIQQSALRVIGPARCAIFVNLVPVFSFILATVMLGEELQPVKILTTIIIIAGVCICQLAGNRSESN